MFAELFILSLLLTCHQCRSKKFEVIIDLKAPIHTTHPLSPSIAGGLTIFQYGWINYFNDTKLMKLAKALGPSYFRVGGTKCDVTYFDPDQQHYTSDLQSDGRNSQCASQTSDEAAFRAFTEKADAMLEADQQSRLKYGTQSILKPIKMTVSEWNQLNDFCECVGWKLIFDLSVQTRDGQAWNSNNARQLLAYTENKYKVDWELGNEPNSYRHKGEADLSAEQIAAGFESLNALLRTSSWWNSSQVYGPDVNNIAKKSARRFLSTYYLRGRSASRPDFTNPAVLDLIKDEVKPLVKLIKSYDPEKQIWLGETASASGGGAPGLSNSYIDGFLWLDKLGLTAKLGVDMVVRQTFIVSRYALLDRNFDPLPDYWLTLLYKKLVGNQVLNVKLFKCSPTKCYNYTQDYLRIYAHCTSPRSNYKRGSVVLYFINLESRTYRLELQRITQEKPHTADLYLLQPAMSGNLTSTQVKLNGKTLQLGANFSLPSLTPRKLHRRTLRKGVRLPHHSYGFIVLKHAMAPACGSF